MLIASHIITAGYVGERIGNPFLAFLVGVVIHFLLDAVPHYDTTDNGEITKKQLVLLITDGAIGILLIIFLLKADLGLKSPFFWGVFGGIFPDILDNVPFWQGAFRNTIIGGKFHKFHDRIQKISLPPMPGLLLQIIIVMIFSYLYLHR